MKKIFLALAALAVIGGAITFVACSKDKTDTETQQVATKNAEDLKIVGYSNPGSMDIIPLVDKDAFLEQLEQYLNSEEAGRYVSEDLKMWHEPYGDGKYAPLMSVSFFDLKEDCGNTLFILMERMEEDGTVYYAVGNGSIHIKCIGKCDSPCRAIPDNNGKFLFCQPCTDLMPYFDFGDIEGRRKWKEEHYCEYLNNSTDSDPLKIKIVISFL